MLELLLGHTGSDYQFAFVAWNLFMAAVPCYIAFALDRNRGKRQWRNLPFGEKTVYGAFFVVWFFFLPNTAYLIAMVRHLLVSCETYDVYHVCREGTWMVPVFFMYALMGVPSFIYALRKMTELIGVFFGDKIKRIFPATLIPVTSFGLLLGLVARYNSWEIIMRPTDILVTSWEYLTSGLMLLNWLIYTATLYALYYLAPPLFRKMIS